MAVLTTETYLGSDCSGLSGNTNRILTLANSSLTSDEAIYLDGLRLREITQYTASHLSVNSTITIIIPVWNDQLIVVDYFTAERPLISNYRLSDYSININETTTASCEISNMTATDLAFVKIGSYIRELSSADNLNYSTILKGYLIGAGTDKTIKFYAFNVAGSDQKTDSNTLTVIATENTIFSDFWQFLYDLINDNVTDPMGRAKWIYATFPEERIKTDTDYPIIIIPLISGNEDIFTFTKGKITFIFSIEVYSTSKKQLDSLIDEIYNVINIKRWTDFRSGYGYMLVKLIGKDFTMGIRDGITVFAGTLNFESEWIYTRRV